MAVTDTRIISVSGGIDREGIRRYEIVFHVSTNNKNDGPIIARSAAAIPVRGSFYNFGGGSELDAGAFLKDKHAKLHKIQETYKEWIVTCKYDSQYDAQDAREDVDDPLDMRTRWSGSYIQFTRNYLKDKDDAQMKDAAGTPFLDPAVVGDDSRLSIVAEKNFISLNVGVWAQFRDAVNNGTWWGLTARKLKVQSITWDQRFHLDIPFYSVRFEFHVNDDTWDKEVLNAGLFEKQGGKRQRISERFGRDVNRPWPLTTGGVALTQAQVDADNETYKTFKIYNEKDFSQLGLPSVLGAA